MALCLIWSRHKSRTSREHEMTEFMANLNIDPVSTTSAQPEDKMQLSLQSRYLRLKTGNLTKIYRCYNLQVAHLFVTLFSVALWYLNWFDSDLFQWSSSIQVQFHQYISPQIILVQIYQCSYSALTLIIQFTSRQANVRPTQRSQIRKFNVDPWPITCATCLSI